MRSGPGRGVQGQRGSTCMQGPGCSHRRAWSREQAAAAARASLLERLLAQAGSGHRHSFHQPAPHQGRLPTFGTGGAGLLHSCPAVHGAHTRPVCTGMNPGCCRGLQGQRVTVPCERLVSTQPALLLTNQCCCAAPLEQHGITSPAPVLWWDSHVCLRRPHTAAHKCEYTPAVLLQLGGRLKKLLLPAPSQQRGGGPPNSLPAQLARMRTSPHQTPAPGALHPGAAPGRHDSPAAGWRAGKVGGQAGAGVPACRRAEVGM